MTSMGHKQGTMIIFIEEGSKCLGNMEFIKDESEVKGHFSSITCSKKFSFSDAQLKRQLPPISFCEASVVKEELQEIYGFLRE